MDRSDWPGERDDPSHRDVVSANERPDPVLLSNFKRALLAGEDAAGAEKLLRTRLERVSRPSRKYTYPLALMSRFPSLPPPDRIDHLWRSFGPACANHVFFDHFPPSLFARDLVAPLKFGMACLTSISMGGGPEEAETLFSAGANLWLSMVEMDNTLARSVEMLLGAVLLVPAGVLAISEAVRTRATLLLPASLTIARRMQIQSSGLPDGTKRRISTISPMLWSLWLWDILQGLQADLPLHFSSAEILSTMPSSSRPFHDVYRDLLDDSLGSGQDIAGGNSRDDAFLLLLAILSDAITLRRSLGSSANVINAAPVAVRRHNHFALFSAHAELARMQDQLALALERWHAAFSGSTSPDLLALHQFCKLYLCCPVLSEIQRAACHGEGAEGCRARLGPAISGRDISDESASCSWALLDSAAACPKSPESLCSAWMPVVVFQAALVVWAQITIGRREACPAHGHTSVRALVAFKMELETMNWPCCVTMCAVLQKLMSA